MDISIRSISSSDFAFLKRVYRSTREDELQLTGWDETQKSKFIEFQFNAQHSHYTNAYDGAELNLILLKNIPVGRLYLWKTKIQIRIMDIALLPDYRGKGIGTRILNSLVQESEESGKKLSIHVEYNNPALHFYEKLDFKKTDDTGVYYFMERLPKE